MNHQQKIEIRGKQSTAWKYLNDGDTTEILYGGGAGGGKSFLGCVWHISRRIQYPGSRGMIGRAKIKILEQSTLVTYFKAAKMLGYQAGQHYKYNQQKHIITWVNGSETILKDLFFYPSDPEFASLGSTEYTDIFIDEVTEITQKAVSLASTRIRWMLDEFKLVPKMLMSCNPAPGWVKNTWVADSDGNAIALPPHKRFVRALVTDNPDDAFVTIYKKQLERMESEYDRSRLLLGDWDSEENTENPFAHQFDPSIHISDLAIFRPELPIIISIDFNLNPFAVTFSHCWHGRDGKYYDHTFDESSIDDGSIPAMIDLIRAKYGKYLHNAVLTGDAMGNKRELSERDNASYYLQLARGLGLSDHQVIILPNPTHRNSRSDVNYILYQSKQPNPKWEVKFHPINCRETISDFKRVKCDNTGGIIKSKRTDPDQRADFMDTKRYCINLKWKKVIEQHQSNQ